MISTAIRVGGAKAETEFYDVNPSGLVDKVCACELESILIFFFE